MKIPLTCLIAALSTLAWTQASEDLPPFLMKQRADYETQLAAVDQRIEEQKRQLIPRYMARLEAIEKKLKAGGDLDGLLAIRRELDRFTADESKSMPNDAIVESPVELRSLQNELKKAVDSFPVDRAKVVLKLWKTYDERLLALEKQFTKMDQIENALHVRKERERSQKDKAVVESRSILEGAPATQVAKKKPATPEDSSNSTGPGAPIAGGLKEGLFLHYTFDHMAGAKVKDVSGQGYDGTPVNVKMVGGKRGKAGLFKGKMPHIKPDKPLRDSITGRGQDYTVAVWARYEVDDGKTSVPNLLSSRGLKGLDFGMRHVTLATWDKVRGKFEKPTTWHHWVGVHKGDGFAAIYRNGELVGKEQADAKTVSREAGILTEKNAVIGSPIPNLDYKSGVLFDDIMLYKRALSAEEVAALFESVSK